MLLQRIKSEQNGTTKLLQNVTIFLNNQQVIVDIICPILFIIADTPAADTMCGRFNSYQLQIGRLHRACNVSPHDADKPNHQCARLTKEQLMHSSCQAAKQARQPLSMHYHPNHAYQHLEIGCDVYGVFGATPMDTMHGIRHRLIRQCLSLLVNNLPAKCAAALDHKAIQFHKRHRQSQRQQFPCCTFANGITNLTQISSEEAVGMTLCWFVSFLTLSVGKLWNRFCNNVT